LQGFCCHFNMSNAFMHKKINIGEYSIDLDIGGTGSPLLLLHGFPETKFSWLTIAYQLMDDHMIIMPDLPGYGDSRGPMTGIDPIHYTKRTIGNVFVKMMKELGYEQFALAGHDRGARVAYRMALDHQDKITKLALLNIIPTVEMIEGLNYDKALKMENWIFLCQPAPFPETMIGGNPAFYLNHILDSWSKTPSLISEESRNIYLRAFEKPEVINGICAEYRASELDAVYDREDRKNHHIISCPLLLLWSEADFPVSSESPLEVWNKWADNITGMALPCGHFLMEEMAEKVIEEFKKFYTIPGKVNS
jgi:haloacetate dehalogenase